MTEGSLSPLNKRLSNIGYSECSFVGRRNVVIDDGGHLESHIVFGDADLFGDLYKHDESVTAL